MAKHSIDLSSEMGALSMDDEDDHLDKLCLDDNLRLKLNKIKNDYETIFSWNIKQQTGIYKQNLMLNLIDKSREKCVMILDPVDVFNINRFYLKLIISYEHYINGNYKESLMEIENIVKSLETCTFNNSNEEYSDACNHIARATNAYIALTLKFDSEKIMKGVKSIKSLNRAEKAAICAVKARVFMEYPPKGNDIALIFADEACNLHSTEPEWIIIWLKAKGRVRRYYTQYKMPEDIEIDAAEVLCTTKSKPRLLISASKLYMEVAFINKLHNDKEQSNKYYNLSLDLTLKAIELSNDDSKQLYSCLRIYIDYPNEFRSNTIIDKMIKKLSSVNNTQVDQVLGKYYLKHEKDYVKAKMYLSRAMAAGDFNSSLQLIKVECLLQPVNKFPLVETLNLIYDVFVSPKRRLIILSQILLYYNYCENNAKELMHYLKLYMDQDIDNSFKKRHLIFAHPLYQTKESFKPKQFLNILSTKIKSILNDHQWTTEEKIVFDDTFDRFNKMSQINTFGNQSVGGNKFEQNYDKTPYNVKSYKCNWRKQKLTSKIDLTKNDNASGSSTQSIDENKVTNNNNIIKLPKKERLTDNKSCVLEKPNNSSNIDTKLNKFQSQYSSTNNLHRVTMENNSTYKKSCFEQKDSDNIKFKCPNSQNRHQNHDGYSLKKNNKSHYTRTYENKKFNFQKNLNGTSKNNPEVDNKKPSCSAINNPNK